MFILENIRRLAQTERIASISNEGNMTYRQLENDSNSLAAFLLEKYPNKKPIIIWGDKENDMLSCVLAALKTGHPYVMIPNYYPEQRVRQIADSCEPCVLLNCSHVSAPDICSVRTAEDLKTIFEQYPHTEIDPALCVQMDDMVCLFYTSGSTGIPKGVIITRRNVEALAEWWYRLIDRNIENARLLNFTPYGFSGSMCSIYMGLGKSGATLYAVDRALSLDYPRLQAFIFQVDPHYLDCTPSFADICMNDERFCSDGLPSMRVLSVGGEPCPHRIAQHLIERFPKAEIINGYGTTETTAGTIACEITMEMAMSDTPLPIGYASFNSRCEVRDEDNHVLPDGEMGELVILSDMVTGGYYKDPERTNASFFAAEDGTRGFHTHDLVWRKDDLFYYVGRVDNMVKVGGYRVEMEEVERYVHQASMVEKCVVAPVMEDNHCVMLSAYIVLKPSVKKGISTTAHLKKELSEKMPAYMIPQKVVYLDELPKNANGKIDRKYLREISKIHG